MSNLPEHFELGVDEPAGWRPRETKILELSYRLDANGKLEYFFRGIFIPTSTKMERIFENELTESEISLSSFSIGILDLTINYDCYIILSLDQKLFDGWQIYVDAITLKKAMQHLYFGLMYSCGGKWLKRKDVPSNTVISTIGFKVKVDSPPTHNDGFNLNVIINTLPQSIDPDIRNPKDP